MDFVPFASTSKQKRKAWIATLGGVALTSGLLSALPIAMLTEGFGSALAGTLGAGLVAGSPVFGLFSGVVTAGIPSEMKQRRKLARTEELRVAVGKHYGLALSADEFAALNYPLNTPTGEFQVYGSIIKVVQVSDSFFVERKIYLVFMDGELKLSSSKDGKRFKELPHARPELSAASAQSEIPVAPNQASSPLDAERIPSSISA